MTSLNDTGTVLVPTLATGDTAQGGARTDEFMLTFTGFGQNDRFQFQVDVDADNTNTVEDIRNVYFNNGAAPNSQISVSFRAGVETGTLVLELPDDPLVGDPQVFDFSVSGTTTAVVPEPSSMVVLVAGVFAFAARRKRNEREL